MRRPPDVATLRALWWARRSLTRLRRDLRRENLTEVVVAGPPRLPADAARGVRYALRRGSPTCLEEALVLQAWHAAFGDRREVVIGVVGPTEDFAAHAWLDGDPTASPSAYAELVRLPAR